MATLRRIGKGGDDEPRRIGFKAAAADPEPDPLEPQRPDPAREEGIRLRLITGEPARTRQLAEWLGLLLVVIAVCGLVGPWWGLLAAGAAIVVSANAS